MHFAPSTSPEMKDQHDLLCFVVFRGGFDHQDEEDKRVWPLPLAPISFDMTANQECMLP